MSSLSLSPSEKTTKSVEEIFFRATHEVENALTPNFSQPKIGNLLDTRG